MKEKLIQFFKKPRVQYWLGILASNLVGALLVLLTPQFLTVISAAVGNPSVGFLSFSLFIGIPIAMGVVSAYCWRKLDFTTNNYFTASLLNTLCAICFSAFLLHEGTICLIIVSPLLYLSIASGSIIGRYMFRENKVQMQLLPLLLFLLAFDAIAPHHYQNVVTDRVVIHARPERVWRYVVAFPPIKAKPTFWLFKAGFPPPLQSTVSGYYLG
ncbi:MAG: hypothetical protein JOZ57_09370, partial [Abitibacteriaceae bacterium]|nr:hypothetical protein [Abditibacteriaceae bacterium]